MKRTAAFFLLGLIGLILSACTTSPVQTEVVRVPASTPPAQEQLEIFSNSGNVPVSRTIEFGIAQMEDAKDFNCATLQDGEFHQEFNRTGYPNPGSAVVLKNTSKMSVLVYLFGHVEFNHKNDQPFVERYFFPKIAGDVKIPGDDITGKYSGKTIQLDPGAMASFIFPTKSTDPTAETFVRLSCKTVDAVRSFQSFGYGTMIEWNSGL